VATRRLSRRSAGACETWRKLAFAGVLLLAFTAGRAAAAPHAPARGDAVHGAATAAAPASVSDEAVAGGHTAEGQHDESIWGFVGKIFNFAILAGTLVYFLRAPIAGYLSRRGSQIRADLETAESLKQAASRQIAEIRTKLEQLPGELDALRARGKQEIAAEEARIHSDAEAERDRLLERTRREIDLQLRVARRELVHHAADLAVGVARERIRQQITDADQLALVDRYVAKVNDRE
jgi:F0F1-type ATP synthase membrane subunit b/b'